MEKQRVLLIDDEVSFTSVMKVYLEYTGRFEVRTANQGREGIALAKAFHPELILLDVIMPDMDGGHVAEQCLADPALASVPVIFLTAVVSRQEAKTKAGLIGGQFFIAKPVGGRELLEAIDRYLPREPAPAGAPRHEGGSAAS